MKRIVLLGFIVFVVPVWMVSCNRFGGSSDFIWTYELKSILYKPDKLERYSENDTTVEDSVRFILGLDRIEVAIFIKNSNSYSVMACQNEFPQQKNYVKSLGAGFVINQDLKNIDTSLMQSLRVCNYQWKGCSKSWHIYKEELINNIKGDYNSGKEVYIKIPFSHKNINLQVLTWAIKENGDTLRAISQSVFCK